MDSSSTSSSKSKLKSVKKYKRHCSRNLFVPNLFDTSLGASFADSTFPSDPNYFLSSKVEPFSCSLNSDYFSESFLNDTSFHDGLDYSQIDLKSSQLSSYSLDNSFPFENAQPYDSPPESSPRNFLDPHQSDSHFSLDTSLLNVFHHPVLN